MHTKDKVTLPSTWKVVSIRDIGTAVTGNTPPKKDLSNYGDYISFVKPPELLDGVITNAADKLSEEGAAKGRVAPPNSILVSCIGNLGKTGINQEPVAFNQQINAILPFEGIEPRFVFYQAQSMYFIPVLIMTD